MYFPKNVGKRWCLIENMETKDKKCHGRYKFSINFLNIPGISKILHFATPSFSKKICILSDIKGYITSEQNVILISNKKFHTALLESNKKDLINKKSETSIQFHFKVWW